MTEAAPESAGAQDPLVRGRRLDPIQPGEHVCRGTGPALPVQVLPAPGRVYARIVLTVDLRQLHVQQEARHDPLPIWPRTSWTFLIQLLSLAGRQPHVRALPVEYMHLYAALRVLRGVHVHELRACLVDLPGLWLHEGQIDPWFGGAADLVGYERFVRVPGLILAPGLTLDRTRYTGISDDLRGNRSQPRVPGPS